MRNAILGLLRDDSAATLVEYSLVVALIAIACIVALTTLGTKVKAVFTNMGNELGAA
jgi:pilus assembly protein Flp/PilA